MLLIRIEAPSVFGKTMFVAHPDTIDLLTPYRGKARHFRPGQKADDVAGQWERLLGRIADPAMVDVFVEGAP